MGAKESSTTAENHFVFKQELGLGFSRSNPISVSSTVRSKVREGRLSRDGLRAVVYELRLTPKSEVIEPFIYSLMSGEEVDWKSLELIGVLLSVGKTKSKADIIFNAFDADASGLLTSSQLKDMLSSLAHVATELTIELAASSRAFLPERLKSYHKSLRDRRPKMVEDLTKTFLEGSETLSLSKFSQLMNVKATNLTSTIEIRKRIEEVEYFPEDYLVALKSLVETMQ
mmetsp:Transcript_6864/g.12486  ORF Transcript_6864/g.12486 Transcript_6864/m.12486 type:complete len:228 (+) Transcript_6864:3760-4443(+)